MRVNAYSLLHIAQDKKNTVNFGDYNKVDPVDVYILNAITLSKSLKKYDIDFTLISNDKKFIDEKLMKLNMGDVSVKVIEIEFDLEIPHDINFYSAHYKISVYDFFSKMPDNIYSIMLDLDMIALNDMPQDFIECVNNSIPMCYEITDQVVPAYGENLILNDLKLLNNEIEACQWFGGEFIAGDSSFFKKMMIEINKIYPIYCNLYKKMHHQGDEMLTTTAIIVLKKNGINILDAGHLKVVCRHWGARIKHKQKSINYAFSCFIIHLPSDKDFLCKNFSGMTSWKILNAYFLHRILKITIRILSTFLNYKRK